MESNSFFLSEQSKAGTLEFEAIINPVKDFVETSCIYDEDA
ncbi:MAG: hypothetical protein U9R08_01050 [Nanoarchaeota archaeon]|nr:hypothetical protein [Nanoarchaeota archaeon]